MLSECCLRKCVGYCLILYCLSFAISVSIANFAIDAAILLTGISLFRSRHDFHPDRRWLSLAALFLGIMAVASLQGLDIKKSFFITWRVAYAMVAPFLLASLLVKTTQQRLQLLGVIILSMTAASLYEILQGLQGRGLDGGFLGRLQLAGQILLVFPLTATGAGLNSWQVPFGKIFCGLGGAILFVALVYSGVRGAWIAFACTGIILFASLPGRTPRRAIVLLAMTTLLAGIILSQPMLTERFVNGITLKTQSVSERILMWHSAYRMFADHPVLGIGPGSFGPLYATGYYPSAAKETGALHPHNIFLQTLAESGMAGMVSFCALWGYTLFRLAKNARHPNADFWQQAAPVAICGWLVLGITDNIMYWLQASFQFLWFMTGAAWNIEDNLKEAS